jgi:hypothetical protein
MTTAVETAGNLVKNICCPYEDAAINQLLGRTIILYTMYRGGRQNNEIKCSVITTTLFVSKQQSFRLRHTGFVSVNLFHSVRSVTAISSVSLPTREVNSKMAAAVCINQECACYNLIP